MPKRVPVPPAPEMLMELELPLVPPVVIKFTVAPLVNVPSELKVSEVEVAPALKTDCTMFEPPVAVNAPMP